MSGVSEDREMMAAEFVLGTLERHDARAIELMAEGDQELAAAIAAWQDRLAPLARLAGEQPAPRDLWARLEDAIAPQVLTMPRPKPRAVLRAWRSTVVWRGTTAGALAMAAAFAGLAIVRNPAQPTTGPIYVAELAPVPRAEPATAAAESPRHTAEPLAQTAAANSATAPGVLQNFAQPAVGAPGPRAESVQRAASVPPQATSGAPGSTLERAKPAETAREPTGFLVATVTDGSVMVKPVGPVRVPAGKELELWAQPPGAPHPTAVGVLPASGMRIAMPEISPANTKLTVSLEPRDGVPGAEPSGRVLYSGTLTPLQ